MDTATSFHLEPHARSSRLSEIILGGQDGLVNVLGVILGIAVASSEIRIILAGGLAATFAESISMAAVAFTSKMAEKDRYFAELEREKKEIKEIPAKEKEEIRRIYQQKGFSGSLLDDIVAHITSDEKIWLLTMMTEKLHLAPIQTKDIIKGSAVVGGSALLGSFVPLAPFLFFSVPVGIVLSLVVSTITLFLVGVYKANTTVGRPLKSGLEIAIIGMGAALVGYGIGILFRVN